MPDLTCVKHWPWLALWLLVALPSLAQEPSFGDAEAGRGLVEVRRSIPDARLDVRYATRHNFMGRVLYPQARVFLARPAVEALQRVQKRLHARGLGVVLLDGYRPWSITKDMWEQTPVEKRQYVADPAKGSRHNRGCAIDLTLQDLKTGRYLEMPSAYDDFTEKAHPDYKGASPTALRNRAILQEAMEHEGFTVYPYEWWHYDFKGWEKFPILNFSFAQLDELSGSHP